MVGHRECSFLIGAAAHTHSGVPKCPHSTHGDTERRKRRARSGNKFKYEEKISLVASCQHVGEVVLTAPHGHSLLCISPAVRETPTSNDSRQDRNQRGALTHRGEESYMQGSKTAYMCAY